MGDLRIHLFGAFRIAREGEPHQVNLNRASRSLLAYLLLHRRPHSRESLTGLLWADHPEDRARNCLRTALWRLRQALDPHGLPRGTPVVTTPAGEVGLDPGAACWVDVTEFQAAAQPVAAKPFHTFEPEEALRLERALALYAGDLLEGFCHDWVLAERERLRCMYLGSLTYLMQYYGYHGEYEKSAGLGQSVIKHDPLREDVHRYLMRLYADSGQRPSAVRQYQACREILEQKLGIEPMEETRHLHARIAEPPSRRFKGKQNDLGAAGIPQVLQDLRSAVAGFQEAQLRLREAIQRVEEASRVWDRGGAG